MKKTKSFLLSRYLHFYCVIPSLAETARTQCNYHHTSTAQYGDAVNVSRSRVKVRTDSGHLGEMRLLVLEEVLLLDLHAVLNQKRTVLLCKCLATVMSFLLGDIPHYHVSVAQVVRKCGILLGPSFKKREVRVLLEPLAGGYFEFLDELGHRQGCRQGDEKMYVVGHHRRCGPQQGADHARRRLRHRESRVAEKLGPADGRAGI